MKPIILCTAWNLAFDDIKPFFLSLAKSNYNGNVCLFCDMLDNDTIEALKAHQVQVISLPLNGLDYDFFSGECYRYLLYLEYLNHCTEFTHVMICDIRDVIFQKNPFDFDINDSLYCFLEERTKTISSCQYNSLWIRAYFGENALLEIGNNPICCSGVTIGSYGSMVNYLKIMQKHLKDPFNQTPRTCGVDQGIHNYIIWKGFIENIKLIENRQGPVVTLGYVEEENIKFNDNGYLVNIDGKVTNIVHQYDRHIILKNYLNSRYV